ncbi:MAG: hypothetical protein LBE92_07420 [Chryseobacterium sp.]|jgi:hypothetical protein|uniref:hypothetical protein n=1 Tax=Chryseobacterium sp. TaxID=1871047 RepID=UPI0028195644|nr:hypothetical protein [Chryseobacterium sp.]MDR2235936.1 hypothetical protein [Chryseobacterium sp.]
MENNNSIKVADLKILLETFLLKLKNIDSNKTIPLEKDLYWNILDEELYEPYKDPTKLTMGNLTDDWEFLQKVFDGKREIIDYDLYKIASILRFLAKSMIIKKA